MRRFVLASLLVVLCCALIGIGVASAHSSGRVFYLTIHPRQCLLVPSKGGGKFVSVVPCSDPAHNQEAYAVGHGGWGHHHAPPYTRAYAIARSFCLTAFRRLTGHPMPADRGWAAWWADPGAETARYGDKIICRLVTWPKMNPFGSGWHVH